MKRLLICCLIAGLLLGMLVVPSHAADSTQPTPPAIPTEGDFWDGVTITQPSKIVQKDGVNYYEISTCAELAFVAKKGGEWLEKNYLLTNNLILNDTVLEWDDNGNLKGNVETLNQWNPIGKDYDSRLSGILDGNNYSISGVVVLANNNESQEIRYVGLFGFIDKVKNLTVVNSYLFSELYYDVGGICGGGDAENCVFSGRVMSSSGGHHTGGITGSGNCVNCTNFGLVCASSTVGGITGGDTYGAVKCINYGKVSGDSRVGGIAGEIWFSEPVASCINYGVVSGTSAYIGGIVGYCNGSISKCANFGMVNGADGIGGIAGHNTLNAGVSNCYNCAEISGSSNVGGIVGHSEGSPVSNCYNVGRLICNTGNTGAVVGSDGAIWDKDTIVGCHYLKNNILNSELFGCGGFNDANLEPEGFYAEDEAAMKLQGTFDGWDFTDIWRIDPDYNNGYPYLAMEDDLPIVKTEAAVTNAPTAISGLVYNGSAQALITAGTATGGTMVYSLTSGGTFSTTIPTGTDAGSYTVYYKVQGDKNHTDTAEASIAGITIAKQKISIPTANSGLSYTGSAQTGVAVADGFTLTQNSATDAGDYTATATLVDTTNTEWIDGTTAAKSIPWGIAKQKLSIPTANSRLGYTGSAQTGVAVADGFTLTQNSATDAGDYTATATLVDTTNTEWSDGTTAAKSIPWSIAKAVYGNKSASGSAKFGQNGTVALNTLLADGYAVGTVTTTDEGLFDSIPALVGTELEFTFASDAEAGKTATVTIPVTGATNYEPYTITVTLTVLDKEAQTLSFTEGSQIKTYGDADFTNAAANTGDGLVYYVSSDTEIATVDYNTGKVTILKVGEVTITAAADETADCFAASPVSYTLTINPKAVKITGLTAADKVYDGTTTVTVSGAAEVDGLVGDDEVAVVAGTAAFADKNVGDDKAVTFTGYSLGGQDAANYTLSEQPSGITASITAKSVTATVTAVTRAYEKGNTTVELAAGAVTGALSGDTVAVDVTAAKGTLEDDNAGTGKPVAVTGVKLSGADAMNYTLENQPAGITATINKIAYDGSTFASGSAKAGKTGTVDLGELIAEGGSVGDITTSDGALFQRDPSVSGTTLSFTFASTAESGSSATITVPVENATNYLDYSITVNVTVEEQQSDSSGSGSSSGGSASGGSGSSKTYSAAITDTEHGTVTLKPKSPSSGTKVTITATPDEGYEVASVKVTGSDGKEVKVTVNADGSYSFTQPSRKVTIEVTFKAIEETENPENTTPAYTENPFADVSENAWYYEAVMYCYEHCYFKGTGENTFDPQGTMTRAMFATVLYRIAGEPAVTNRSPFKDVDSGLWYSDAIAWASSEGIIHGYEDGSFGTNDPVTREQIAVLLWRLMGKPSAESVDLSAFTDAGTVSNWARDAIAWAVSVGLLKGNGDGTLNPGGTATRAEVAQIVMNYDTTVK